MAKILCPLVFMVMRRNNAFCSICTVNYTSFAGVLNESLVRSGNNDFHYVLIVDYDVKHKDIIDKFNFIPVFLEELKIPKIDELIGKYNAFELSNVLKPFFMEWLLKKYSSLETLVYLDTDIYVYKPMDEIFNFLEENSHISVVLTQHIKDYNTYNNVPGYGVENLLMRSGLYNGGFYALKNNRDSIKFLDWQKRKLFNYGYNAPELLMFVDQKILDFAPILFDFVGIFKNKTYNVAHWNYYENKMKEIDGVYYVGEERLTFFHFSNLKICEGDPEQSKLFAILLNKEPVLKKTALEYWENLKRNDYFHIRDISYKFNERNKPSFPDDINFFLPRTKSRLIEYSRESNVEREILENKSEELNKIINSKDWELILKLRKLFNIFFPIDSLRRMLLIKFLRFIKKMIKIALRIKGALLGVFLLAKNYLMRFEPRRKRKINLKSKKLVYVGHSYHNKTKSTVFLIDYLREFFDVEVILDESWNGGSAPELSFIDESYLGVIFFQLLPSREIIGSIKNDNIIYFPMYDQSGRLELNYWNNYKDLKIINFSNTLHKKLKKWGFESMHVQYFPKKLEFIPGKRDEVFFWQRLTRVAISTIMKLLSNSSVKIHIHKAVDPGQEFIQPSEVDEEKFQITYSNWFDTREEMWDVIKQKGVYIAPREYEGIGMSFLEAMSMGKAVIAVDNPTMNEYIEHGKTGYLYDLKNPKEIDLSNIEEVQKNTYKYMQEGFQKWETNKREIIEFIKK